MSVENSELSSILSGVIEVIVATGNLKGLEPDEDFYDAGISSVMSLPILLDLEDRYGVSLPDDRFISARSPRALAEIIADLKTA